MHLNRFQKTNFFSYRVYSWLLPFLLISVFSTKSAFSSQPKTAQDFISPSAVVHSQVREQGNTGFCWAYSTTAMLEAEILREREIRVDLSEEYLGFFHFYDQVLRMAPKYFKLERSVSVDGKESRPLRDLFNGAVVSFVLRPSEGAPDLRLGIDLIQKYGIVPESAFRFKASKGLFASRIQGRARRFINDTLRDPVKNKAFRKRNLDGSYSNEPDADRLMEALARVYTDEMDSLSPAVLAEKLLKAYRFGFGFDRVLYKPKTFARNVVGFNHSDYRFFEVTPANEAEQLMVLRQSLSDGRAVQLGFMLNENYSDDAKTSGILQNNLCDGKVCAPAGGHAVLLVNEARSASTHELAGFVIQNSWGPVGLDDEGKAGGEKGFQILTLDYLRRIYTLEKASLDNRHWSFLVKDSSSRDAKASP